MRPYPARCLIGDLYMLLDGYWGTFHVLILGREVVRDKVHSNG